MLFEEAEIIVGQKQRIAPARPGVLNRGAIARRRFGRLPSSSITEMHSPAMRMREKPGVTGFPS